jgi:quinol-cytochrome oxidoreductase complex cytochrome b subunit
VLVLQLLTGFLLTLYYRNDSETAFASVDYIRREVHYGWLVYLLHVNGATLFFGLMYLHIFKGLFFARYRLRRVWFRGFIILILSMATAFLGYVLPNAQIRYWACVVITSLLRVLPAGSDILLWVWGGYSVNSATLKLCFTLHYLLP